MPVPSQGHYGFHSFTVVDWFCLFIYLWHTLIKKIFFTFFVETLSLYIFTIWKPSFIIVSAETEYILTRSWYRNINYLRDRVKMFLTFTFVVNILQVTQSCWWRWFTIDVAPSSLNLVLHWQLFYLFCSSIVINTGRDGIYFDKILVSEYKLFKRSNKANLLIALVQ
jgi:hypothetical protein